MLPPITSAAQWINRPEQLHKLAEELVKFPRLAVDTESNSLHAYREQVCLLQFSTPVEDYLIDPLALPVLSPLCGVFNHPVNECVFHAAEYDILCLKRDFGFQFANIFDTMLAARILGRSEVGLSSLLQAEFGIQLDKHNQRADWGRRPLPHGMLNYARLDTHYLLPLRERLGNQLVERNLLPLAEEDFSRLTCLRVPAPAEAESAWDLANSREISPAQAAVLQALLDFRDQCARAADVPPFKILGNSVLVALAREQPTTLEGLSGFRGLTGNLIQKYGPDLLHAIQRGKRSAPLPHPHHPHPPAAVLKRQEKLRSWRKLTAQAQGVESDVVLPRDILQLLAQQPPQNSTELADLFHEIPWRLERYGDDILKLLNKGSTS